MTRIAALSVIALWFGATLLLSELRWFRRLPLVARLSPFTPGGARLRGGSGHGNRSFGDVLGPVASSIGERVSRGLGVSEELALRLERVHSGDDPTTFRTRQVGRTAAALVGAVAVAFVLGLSGPLAVGLVVIAPVLVFLSIEQALAKRSGRHQERLMLELPVVAEQLGMLLSSGYSLGGAVARIAERSNGACAMDLRRLTNRLRQGVGIDNALREWGRTAGLASVHQLVSVLTLHHDASDLGRLISNEARGIRRIRQRDLIERIERRNEQVWIPVTVATLIPGVVFLAVPFSSALSGFGSI